MTASQGNHEIVNMTKKVGGENFQDMNSGKIQELIGTTPEKLTEDDLIESSAPEPVSYMRKKKWKKQSQKTDITQSDRRVPIIQDCF